MRAQRAVVVVAAMAALLAGAGCTGGSEGGDSSGQHPMKGPEYDAAMERCALSRLRNAGVEDPSPESWAYGDAYAACTYGTSFDDVSAPGRGWSTPDPGYWDN